MVLIAYIAKAVIPIMSSFIPFHALYAYPWGFMDKKMTGIDKKLVGISSHSGTDAEAVPMSDYQAVSASRLTSKNGFQADSKELISSK